MLERLSTSLSDRKVRTARMNSRAWSTPEVGIMLGTLFLLYFLSSFIGLFIYEEQIPLIRLAVTGLIYILVMVLIALINHRRGGSWTDSYGMGFRQLRKMALSPVLYLALLPILIVVTNVWHLLLQHVAGLEIELQDVAQVVTQEPSWLRILYILMAILVAPFFEEILFRGIAFPYLVKHIGLTAGTLLVSVFFALMHFHLPAFVPLLLLSAALSLVYWHTGSLWVGIGMHAIFNAVSILALNLNSP